MRVLKSKFDIVIDIICLICLIGLILFLAISWSNIPEQVPGHYNARGEVDKLSGKGSLIGLAAINWGMYIGMFIVDMFPRTWNTGVKITRENAARVYRTIKSMLGVIKLVVVLILTFLTVNSALAKPLPALFTPITLISTFGSIIFFTVKLRKVK